MSRTVATACANIALVKYWGKRDLTLNLPEAGSLSITLDALRTWTSIELDADADADTLILDGRPQSGRPLARVSAHLDRVRSPDAPRARIRTFNAFPSAAGLASSASGFAALSVAACGAYGVEASGAQLSVLARRGSGSAARSIFGGWVKMDAGQRADGEDACARPLDIDLELSAAIAVATAGEKEVGSTEGMERTRTTSPYHASWIAKVDEDLRDAEAALRSADLERLATIVEGSCLAMHADAMAARPGIIYFNGVTLWALEEVRRMRAEGTPVMFTIDAGPHVVALTPPEHLDAVAARLAANPAVTRVITSKVGSGAALSDAPPEQLDAP